MKLLKELEEEFGKVEREHKGNGQNIVDFSQIVKKAYEKGMNETELTLEKLIEDLKADLRNLVI